MTHSMPPVQGAMKADDERLLAYFSDEAQRRQVTQAMFNEAASGYDSAEALPALGSGSWYRREVLRREGLKPGMHVLDVAAGTGLVTAEALALAGPDGRVIALDPSPGMLAQLRSKLSCETIEAYAESIPLPDAQMDFLSMGYALRHVGDLDRAFAEYRRVLKPGGKVCIMEISRPSSRLGRALLKFHIGVMVPLMARLSGRHADVKRLWAYYGDTIEAAVDPDTVMSALRHAGFSDVRCGVTLGIFREYTGKK